MNHPNERPATPPSPGCTRGEFLRRSSQGLGAAALLSALPAAARAEASPSPRANVSASRFDLREFVQWIVTELEPSVRLSGGAGRYARKPGEKECEIYGTSDIACILYSIGRLRPSPRERTEWAAAFQQFQRPDTGWLVEKSRTHDPLHNTAFALAAMQLLDLEPGRPVTMPAEFAHPAEFLGQLDWRTAVYLESHKGAGAGAIHALVPALRRKAWFDEYFAFCDAMFDPRNGMMGRDKPAGGDSDQVGGTFHYGFLYEHFNRHMPFPEARIDAVLRTQMPDGYWRVDNHLWLTLDAIYLMTRSLRYTTHRFDDVRACVRRLMGILMRDVYSPEGRKTALSPTIPVHSVTAAISIAAEVQRFLGADEVVTEEPLRLVLDRRPFI
jgi:hypothetical protein